MTLFYQNERAFARIPNCLNGKRDSEKFPITGIRNFDWTALAPRPYAG